MIFESSITSLILAVLWILDKESGLVHISQLKAGFVSDNEVSNTPTRRSQSR
jgi:predicted RNA-binding protein with RPS1 domain